WIVVAHTPNRIITNQFSLEAEYVLIRTRLRWPFEQHLVNLARSGPSPSLATGSIPASAPPIGRRRDVSSENSSGGSRSPTAASRGISERVYRDTRADRVSPITNVAPSGSRSQKGEGSSELK